MLVQTRREAQRRCLCLHRVGQSERRGSDRHTFAITEDGLLVGNEFFPYEKIKNFYIIYQPPDVKMLYFDPKNILRPLIGIPLDDQNPSAIREILSTFGHFSLKGT